MSRYSTCPQCGKKGRFTSRGYDPFPERGPVENCRYCNYSHRMTKDNEYKVISAEIEKVITRLTNDTRTCICTLHSLTITRDSFALSILGLTLLQEKIDKLAAAELEWTAKHIVNPPSDYPPLPPRLRMPPWIRFWDWLLRRHAYTSLDFSRDDDHYQKFNYFNKLYRNQTKFDVVIGPSEDDTDPRSEVLKGVRVTGVTLSCGDGPSLLSFDGSPREGLSVDIAWKTSRPCRTGWKARLLGS